MGALMNRRTRDKTAAAAGTGCLISRRVVTAVSGPEVVPPVPHALVTLVCLMPAAVTHVPVTHAHM